MKCVIKILLAILLCIPSAGFAYRNEPNGFRDLYWGESLEEIKQNREVKYLSYTEKTNSVSYAVFLREDEPHVLSNVPIWGNGFVAVFWNDKLTNIYIYFVEKDAFTDLKYSMRTLYGRPFMETPTMIIWSGDSTVITLQDEKPNESPCTVHLNSSQVTLEEIKGNASRGW